MGETLVTHNGVSLVVEETSPALRLRALCAECRRTILFFGRKWTCAGCETVFEVRLGEHTANYFDWIDQHKRYSLKTWAACWLNVSEDDIAVIE